jgi:glycosyltransferase involved in cell wall biosynthesis
MTTATTMAAPKMTSADLDGNDRELAALTATAHRHLAGGRLEAAATYAQVAGQFAWMNHTGRFASPELERLLGELGRHLAPRPRRTPPNADPRDVLHVVTQAYQTGGSTREIDCWLEQDTGRRHRVCITRQGPTPPPDFLARRLGSASDLIRLDTARGGLLARAAKLRAIAADADVVVLHVHPYDVVPVIAFAGQDDAPPVITVNHADHVFWLGTSVTDVLFNMRESGRELATRRRGVEPARSIVMARPLMPGDRTHDRAEAKRHFGIDPEAVVLATAADASKYRPVGDDSFLGLVLPVLERHPEAILLAAGPADDGEWAEAARRTGGRVRALGRLADVTLLHEAADVYLDSFPFSSLTSLLEAGSFGTPALTYRGHPEDCGVLGAEIPGVDQHMLCPADPEAFDAALERAVLDAPWRRALGERTRDAIRATHTGDGWRTAIDAVYAHAARMAGVAGVPIPGPAPRAVDPLDVLVHDVMVQTGFSTGPYGALWANLGLLPVAQRLAVVAPLARNGRAPSPRDMVPEWLRPALADARRGARALAPGGSEPGAFPLILRKLRRT